VIDFTVNLYGVSKKEITLPPKPNCDLMYQKFTNFRKDFSKKCLRNYAICDIMYIYTVKRYVFGVISRMQFFIVPLHAKWCK